MYDADLPNTTESPPVYQEELSRMPVVRTFLGKKIDLKAEWDRKADHS